MIGISIAAKKEWNAVLEKYKIALENCSKYPFGEYFKTTIANEEVLFYRVGVRKVNCSAGTQYMIDHFHLTKVIVIGTCAGIDDTYKPLDIIIPHKFVQYDCTVKETEPLIKDSLTVNLDLTSLKNINTGTLGTADKAVVMWKDYLELKNNHITIADTESAAIIYVCKKNNIKCLVIKGISDFPLNENDAYNKQLDSFTTNIPIIINNIIDNYLNLAIKNDFNYID